MQEKRRAVRYPVRWTVRCLCGCKKSEEERTIYHGVTRDVSELGLSMVSDHNICSQRSMSMQLQIPSFMQGGEIKILYIVGRTTHTFLQGGKFVTGIEFLQFEQSGDQILRENLLQRFGAEA